MADLEETQLLRALTLSSFAAVSLTAGAVSAQMPDFAEGGQGDIAPSIPQMLNDAQELGRDWADRLEIQEPDDFGRDLDFEALRDRALNHPRVRALMNADDPALAAPSQEQRYGNSQIFVFASFSMPDPSLRAMMSEARDLDIPVVFRGFVDNDIFATRERLIDVFGSDEDIIGFSIDPTLFSRFAIEAVPAVVIAEAPVEPCLTMGCLEDVAPPHDIVRGNVPVIAALEISARAGAEGAQMARAMLLKALQP